MLFELCGLWELWELWGFGSSGGFGGFGSFGSFGSSAGFGSLGRSETTWDAVGRFGVGTGALLGGLNWVDFVGWTKLVGLCEPKL